MMAPNAHHALIAPEKITAYLLDPLNPQNRGKAGYFRAFGFAPEQWEVMAAALRAHLHDHPVSTVEDRPDATVYTVDGALATPDGRSPQVRTVWRVLRGETSPHFVTAFPSPRRRSQ